MFLLRKIVVFEDVVVTDVMWLYDASYKESVACTPTARGFLIIAHSLYEDPETRVKPNDADITALSCGVSAELSANVGTVTIMHINSASAIHRIFFFIATSKK